MNQTPQQESENAWREHASIQTKHVGEYMGGHRDTKSAIIRQIEKRIEHLRNEVDNEDLDFDDQIVATQLLNENKRLLNTILTLLP